MKHKKYAVVFVFIFTCMLLFTACESGDPVKTSDQNQPTAAENQNSSEAPATYKYIDPNAVISVTGVDSEKNAKWKVYTAENNSDKVLQIVDLVNSGIDRKEPTKAQLKVFKNGDPAGISIKFNDESNSIVNVYPVYKEYNNGTLEKPSKDLYLFENIVNDNIAYFTISSKDMVNYLLKEFDKDFKASHVIK